MKPLTSAELVARINPLLQVNDPEAQRLVYDYLCRGLLEYEMIPYLIRTLGLVHLPRLEAGSEAIQKQWVTYAVRHILYSFIAGYQTANNQPNRKDNMNNQQNTAENVSYETWVRDVYKAMSDKDIRAITAVTKYLAEPQIHEGHVQALLVHLGLHTFDEATFIATPSDQRNPVPFAVWSIIKSYQSAEDKTSQRAQQVRRIVDMPPFSPSMAPTYHRFDHLYRPDWRDNRNPSHPYQVGDFPGYGPHVGTPRPDSTPNDGAQPIDLGQILQAIQELNRTMSTVVQGLNTLNDRVDKLESQQHKTTRTVTGTVEDLRPDNIPQTPPPTSNQLHDRNTRTGTVADLAPRERDQPDGHNQTGHSSNLIWPLSW